MLIVATLTLLQLTGRREEGGSVGVAGWQQKNMEGWLEVGWRMAGGWHDQDNWITTSSNQILGPNFISLNVGIFQEQSPPPDRADISSVLI